VIGNIEKEAIDGIAPVNEAIVVILGIVAENKEDMADAR
jgi:hypothetical protein